MKRPAAVMQVGLWLLLGLLLGLLPALAVTGCSFLNKPDPALLQGVDTGPPPIDGGLIDGCVAHREQCGDGVDNDCDGLVDCADFQCAPRAECCRPDATGRQTEDWVDLVGWTSVPSLDRELPRRVGGTLTEFGTGTIPRAIVRTTCTPLALGVTLSLDMRIPGTGTCARDCFAALVLTPAQDVLPGRRLLDDVAVRLDFEGRVSVTQAGTEIAAQDGAAGVGERLILQLTVAPGLDQGGRPALLATVSTENRATGAMQTVLDAFPFVRQSELIDNLPNCMDTPGLFLAVEGQGSLVTVERLTTNPIECVNPSQFLPPRRPESATLVRTGAASGEADLGFGAWASGGIAAPALVATATAAGVRWDLMVDATDVDREIGAIADIGFALGHATASVPGAWDGLWSPVPSAAGPKAGNCHPSCVPGSPAASCGMRLCGATDTMTDLREPSLLAETGPDGTLAALHVAAAHRVGPGPYSIAMRENMPRGLAAAVDSAEFTADSLSDGACQSVRDPALVPRRTGYWLFYTCESDGLAAEIHATQISAALAVVPGSHRPVIMPAVGAYGAGGVRAPEVLVDQDPMGDRAVFRIWFLARDRGGAHTTIAMAQGQTTEGQAMAGELPVFVPYAANPVLTVTDPALDRCGETCDLLGLAVARRPDDRQTVRFLVARSVNGAMGLRYELVPLEQYWRSPWMAP